MGKSIGEALVTGCDFSREVIRDLKIKDPSLITPADLEEIISDTRGENKTIQRIANLDCSPDEKVEILQDYLSHPYPSAYLKAVWDAYEGTHFIPTVNAGVVERQMPGNSMGENPSYNLAINDLIRILTQKKARRDKSFQILSRLLKEEMRRYIDRQLGPCNNSNEKKRKIIVLTKELETWVKQRSKA